jgi:hypothetical protein
MRGKLTQDDAATLREMAELYRQGRLNVPNLESETELVSVSTDVYVARTPATGIPKLQLGPGSAKPETGTGSGYGDMPGSAQCIIYRLTDARPQKLQRVFYDVPVYNLSRIAVAGSSWALVARDKFGTWWIVSPLPNFTPPPPYCPDGAVSNYIKWRTKCVDKRLLTWYQYISLCPTPFIEPETFYGVDGCCNCGTGTNPPGTGSLFCKNGYYCLYSVGGDFYSCLCNLYPNCGPGGIGFCAYSNVGGVLVPHLTPAPGDVFLAFPSSTTDFQLVSGPFKNQTCGGGCHGSRTFDTACCATTPEVIPVTFSGAAASLGTVNLVYSSINQWWSAFVAGTCGEQNVVLSCNASTGRWSLTIYAFGFLGQATFNGTCSPTSVSGTYLAGPCIGQSWGALIAL